jgi:signal transduction histidine kinase
MNRVFLFFLWLTLDMFLCTGSFSQAKYSISNFNTDNGLPQNTVKDFLFDNAGYLWISTENGLVRYDGKLFKVFSTPEATTLNNRILMLTSNIEKRHFVTDVNNRLEEIRDGKLFLVEKGKPGRTADMDHLFGSQLPYGLFKKLNQVRFLSKRIDGNSMGLIPLSPTQYLVTYDNRVDLYVDTVLLYRITYPSAKPFKLFKSGSQVIAFNEILGFYELNAQVRKWEPLINKTGINNIKEWQLVWRYNQSSPYLVYDQKIYTLEKRDRALYKSILIDSLVNSSRVTRFEFSQPNNIYVVGTESEGLFIYREKRFHQLTAKGENKPYYGQLPISGNSILTQNGDIISQEGKEENKLPIKKFFNYIISDPLGNIYYTIGDSVFKFNPLSNSTSTLFINKGSQIFALEYNQDTLWMINSNGIFYHTKDSNYISLIFPPNVNNIPYAIERISPGKFLFGNCLGLFAYQHSLKKTDTLLWSPQKCIRTLWKYKNYIFIGTYGGGWKVWNGKNMFNMPLDRDQHLLFAHCFVKDSNNYLWIPTNRGLFKYYLPDIEAYISGKSQSIYYYQYGKEEGIENTEFNGGCYPCYVKLQNGYTSLPNLGGLVWFKPEYTDHSLPVSPVFIDRIEINDKEGSFENNTIKLPTNVQQFRIELSSPFFGNPINDIIEYRTIGIDTSWKQLNPATSAIRYTTLPAGSYKIEIRKAVGFGKPYYYKTIDFEVATPWYRTSLAIAIWIVSLIILVLLILRWRVASYRKQQIVLEKLVDKKVGELKIANNKLEENLQALQVYQLELLKRDMNKSRYIKIISHDIIGPLRFIDMITAQIRKYGKKTRVETVMESVADIGMTSRNLLDLCNDMINWINLEAGEINISNDYFDLHQLITEKVEVAKRLALKQDVNFIVNCPTPFYIRNDRNVSAIILQNLLTNALKFTKDGTIETGAVMEAETFYLYVKDTGQGMSGKKIEELLHTPASELKPGNGNDSGYGLGYTIIKDLLDLTKGTLEIQSDQQKGTIVKVRWPILTSEQHEVKELSDTQLL